MLINYTMWSSNLFCCIQLFPALFIVQDFQGPDFSGSRFFWVPVFPSPGFSSSRFFWVQVFLGPGFSGSRIFRARVQVLEVSFFMNKNTIETTQTNSILRLFIAKIIDGKVNCICQICKIAEWFDCVMAPERSDSACYINLVKPQVI